MSARTGLLGLLVASPILLGCQPLAAEPQVDAGLSAKIQQLEKRIAQLEQALKTLQAAPQEPGKLTAEVKIVGTRLVAEEDRKEAPFTDLKASADGKYDMAMPDGEVLYGGKWKITGTQVEFVYITGGPRGRILSLTDTEFVLEHKQDKGRGQEDPLYPRQVAEGESKLTARGAPRKAICRDCSRQNCFSSHYSLRPAEPLTN